VLKASFRDTAGPAKTLDLKLWAILLLLLVSLNTDDLASLFPSAYLDKYYQIISNILNSVWRQRSLSF
jgi:hypothetical protein